MLTLRPGAFVETEGCDGPKYIRGQPSRSSDGVIMTEIQDKYIPEFELPYRNIERYIKEMSNNWHRLNQQQREMARLSFEKMGMGTKLNPQENFSQESILESAKFIAKEPTSRPKELLNMLWNPTESEKISMKEGLSSQEADSLVSNLKESISDWVYENSYEFCTNLKPGLLIFFTIVLFLLIGMSVGMACK